MVIRWQSRMLHILLHTRNSARASSHWPHTSAASVQAATHTQCMLDKDAARHGAWHIQAGHMVGVECMGHTNSHIWAASEHQEIQLLGSKQTSNWANPCIPVSSNQCHVISDRCSMNVILQELAFKIQFVNVRDVITGCFKSSQYAHAYTHSTV